MKTLLTTAALAHLTIGVLLVSFSPASFAAPDSTWTEKFTYTGSGGTGTRQSMPAGWKSFAGASADSVDANPSNNIVGVTNNPGSPNTDASGFVSMVPGTTNRVMATFTTFATGLDLAGSTVTWDQGNANTASEVRLLVKIGDNWYASASSFANTITYTATTFSTATPSGDLVKALDFSTAASNWLTVTVTESRLTLGSISGLNLISSIITGIGFYVTTTGNHTVRLDHLVVPYTAGHVVPEPATVAALAGLGALALAAVAKKK